MDHPVTTHSDEPPAAEHPRTLTLRGATVLGIGSMIGAGIFALLGEAGAVTGAAALICSVAVVLHGHRREWQ